MKSLRIAFSIVLVLTATMAIAQTNAQKTFDKLKTLDGMWEGKDPQGQDVKVSYRSTSGGSALMSEIMGKEDMITMFHLDGDRVLMTHYCGAGNQPRMKATASPDGETITFDFLDATNLASADAGHMHRMVLTLIDPNHHTEEWTFLDHGKEMKETFALQRKKAI
jgi:hypothetical protein